MQRVEQVEELLKQPDFVVTAGQMSLALNIVAAKLLGVGIITSEGFSVLTEEARRLKLIPAATSWEVEIDRDNAVTFNEAIDEHANVIFPRICCKGIQVEQNQAERPPFISLDIALEIHDSERKPISRWHVDWANDSNGIVQSGPLVHLQFGGHVPGHRDTDHPLKVPRWCHPPMDVLLLCELVAANFYEEKWDELREDANWCTAITMSQRLCYSAYFEKMKRGLSISSRTLLHSMWASHWTA